MMFYLLEFLCYAVLKILLLLNRKQRSAFSSLCGKRRKAVGYLALFSLTK